MNPGKLKGVVLRQQNRERMPGCWLKEEEREM